MVLLFVFAYCVYVNENRIIGPSCTFVRLSAHVFVLFDHQTDLNQFGGMVSYDRETP